jgi:hypothetical protein
MVGEGGGGRNCKLGEGEKSGQNLKEIFLAGKFRQGPSSNNLYKLTPEF